MHSFIKGKAKQIKFFAQEIRFFLYSDQYAEGASPPPSVDTSPEKSQLSTDTPEKAEQDTTSPEGGGIWQQDADGSTEKKAEGLCNISCTNF